MGLRKVTCGFELCKQEFSVPASNFAQFCSNECLASFRIMKWAPILIAGKREGKTNNEIGKQLGMTPELVHAKTQTLRAFRQNYSRLDLRLKEIERQYDEQGTVYPPRNGSPKLTAEQVKEIRAKRDKMTQRALAINYKVSQGTISMILLNRTYKDV